MKKSDVLEISREYGLSPNKRLGQNFLVSTEFTEKLLNSLNISQNDRILEIGPGLGAMTQGLSERSESVTVVEIDSGLVRFLSDRFRETDNIKIIHADFLKVKFEDEYTKIVSNMPYYCASEMLFQIARDYTADEIYIMIQKEMADRIVSSPGTKNYGALTITLGFYFKAQILFNVKQGLFYPRPDVLSSFVKLEKRKDLPLDSEGIEIFHKIVKSAFWGRRKTLLKALSDSPHMEYSKDIVRYILEESGTDTDIRGETLSIDDYIRIVKQIQTSQL